MKEFKILEDLVKINTINDKNNKEFISYISELLIKKGFNVEILKNKDNKSCLIAKTREVCKLCFMGHSDTVVYSEGWSINPFELTKKGNYLYGLGVCDMKGGIAAFLDSIQDIDLSKIEPGIMLIITYDEEIGFEGIKFIKDREDIPNNVIICEPTDLEPIISCKGCMEYKVLFEGYSVHSSMMINGDNAILKAMDFIKELNRFFNKLKMDNNNTFDIPFTTMNIATINGGTVINIVPSICELSFDFRTVKKNHHELIRKKIDKLCKKYKAKYEIITDVMPTNNESKESIGLIEQITNKKSTGVNYVTEGNFLENKNIIILGPGPVTAHEVDEHIEIDSYNKTVIVYKKIIQNICK